MWLENNNKKNSIGISFSPLICPDKCPGLESFMDIKIGKGKKENQLISKCCHKFDFILI